MSKTTTRKSLADARKYFDELPLDLPLMQRYEIVAQRVNADQPDFPPTSALTIAHKASKEDWPRHATEDTQALYKIVTTLPLPTEADYAQRLQNVARHTLVLAEGLVSAVPVWMATIDPSKWSVDQGLKVMRALPDFLSAAASLDKLSEELRARYARQVSAGIENAAVVPPPIVEALESCNALIAKARAMGG